MTNNRFADKMAPEELFALATQQLRNQAQVSMTNLELGLETVSRHLNENELQRQLEMPESPAARKRLKCGQNPKYVPAKKLEQF